MSHFSGRVTIGAQIDETGAPSQVWVEQSATDPDKATQSAAKKVKQRIEDACFIPAQLDGKAVATVIPPKISRGFE